ncbi:MAG TPA: serine/threonine-protein kinase [Polyangia bacterium]|nr:serine/threonine-protein kinase [Polyangia bacterium]
MISSGCLTDEVLVDMLERRLTPDAVSDIHGHAAQCPPCRKLLIEIARNGPPPGETGTIRFPSSKPPPSPSAPSGSSPDTVGAWEPPQAFDEFRLVRVLGRGGMGVVYLAHDTTLDRLVAIKFIAAAQPSESSRVHFTTEARAIARLKHPNVVTVHRVGEVEGHPYLVSEYIVGQRLSEVELPMPWRRVLGIGYGLAQGLGAAHRQGVLHRDIKPGNVILAFDGEVKLLDFGLAELIDDAAGVSPNAPRSIAGTPRYMAPEVLKGGAATPQSDIYALGLVLHELCTGTVAHRKDLWTGSLTARWPEAGGAAARAPVHEKAGPPGMAVSGIDPDFTAIIDRCLRSEPVERFGSVEALLEELERLVRPGAARLLPAGNPYRGLYPFEAKHRALFFGRDDDARAILERLRHESLVLIAGDSGAGKSSLCRAGIVPRIAEGGLDEDREFTIVSMWPGRHPVAALAAALAPVLGRNEAELGAALAATSDVAWLGQELRERCREARGVLLLVDQLEELLTLSDPAGAARLGEILAELALPAPGVRVLLAVRGDFLTRLGALRGLGDHVQRALYLLRPLSPAGMREAIVGPARSQGVVFESEALIATLMESMEQGAGSLPLLQFALAELWERRDRASGRLTRAALEAMGGVAGALSRHADAVMAQLGPGERQAARRLFVRLVTGEGTRITRTEAELGMADDEARAAARALVEGRLLYTAPSNGEPTYQMAHEALIESWGTLRNWLDEDIGHRAIRQRIEAASAEWERLGRAGEALWSERQLDEVRPIDPVVLGPNEQRFLAASHGAIRRRRLLQRLVWVGAVVVPLLLVSGSYVVLRVQRHFENERFIGALVGAAQGALAEGRASSTKASERQGQALALFDGQVPASGQQGQDTWDEAEKVWAEAIGQMKQADTAYAYADQALATALLRDSSHRDARRLRAELTYERILMAERFHQSELRDELLRLLDPLDEEHEWRRRLLADAELSVETTPPGARVTLKRYVSDRGLRRLADVSGLEAALTTPIAGLRLPPGSYLLSFALAGRAPVQWPILLERGERPRVRLDLPVSVPEGYVYIPPGCFLYGCGDPETVRKFLHTAPLHRTCRRQAPVAVTSATRSSIEQQ